MQQVTPNLLLGDSEDAEKPAKLAAAGVTAVVRLTHSEPEASYPEDISVSPHPLIDGPQNDIDNFRRAVTEVVVSLRAEETVFVHCSAGSSRSGAVAVAAMAILEETTVENALENVVGKKPDVAPHTALLEHAEETVSNPSRSL